MCFAKDTLPDLTDVKKVLPTIPCARNCGVGGVGGVGDGGEGGEVLSLRAGCFGSELPVVLGFAMRGCGDGGARVGETLGRGGANVTSSGGRPSPLQRG